LPRRDGDVPVAGVVLRRPMLEVHTIAAGGGSILDHDGRRLTVGPESAGANPGPQCYGRGGPPTLTDAALVAGLVDPQAFDPPLRAELVSLPDDAEAYLNLAVETMAQAAKQLGMSRGIDLRDHALVSYGGAAGQYAARVAERLEIATVLIHPCAAVLSAWGQCLARPEATAVAPLWSPLEGSWETLTKTLQELEDQLPDLGETLRTVELRHQGTDHPIELPMNGDDEEDIARAFQSAHRARYGFDRPELSLELVNARVRVRAPAPVPPSVEEDPRSHGDTRVIGPQLNS
ncbi:MAG: hydantoinase/oxoprolinase family protein, partial [Myxococcota bacterium]|nr:hydantoinase/oxoprolinase family protein [Myxococcota bacterium]